MTNNTSVKPFYITTPIFYPNGKLHIGHAYAATMCDILARMARVVGRPTYFLTGADENSLKVQKTADAEGKDVIVYLDEQAAISQRLFRQLDISYDQYIRTTDPDAHHPGVIEMWNRLDKAGDIYEGSYEGYYCVGCEGFKTEKDLINGCCPIHETPAEFLKEKNYFFRLSKYRDRIQKAIESDELLISPLARKNEILAVLEEGLDDISFSRPYHGQKNAILVPNDPTQAIYVWGDALVNYISALGFGTPTDGPFKQFWPEAIHLIGKDILRFHAAIWPGMLMSAGLSLPKKILVTGLMQSGGKKMSKSLGNVIDPDEMIALVGAEGLRFFFAYNVPLLDDGEISPDLITWTYNAHLANGIGNLTNRLLKMMISYDVQFDSADVQNDKYYLKVKSKVMEYLDDTDVNSYARYIWDEMKMTDIMIQTGEPFRLFKTEPKKARELVADLMIRLYTLTTFAQPILPHGAPEIIKHIEVRQMPESPLYNKI